MILCGQTEPLRMTAEIAPLHRFDLPGAPVTAWRAVIHTEHAGPNAWQGPRRETRDDAVADLLHVTGGNKHWMDASTLRDLEPSTRDQNTA